MANGEKKQEDWMNSKWRPMMGWMYMGVCVFDFNVFPVGWSLIQAMFHGTVQTQWQPLTLQGAGLFHMAMGAVLGIAAYGRTKEKMAGAEQGGLGDGFGPGAGTTYVPPNQGSVSVVSNNTAPSNFGTNNSFNTSASNFSNSGSFASSSVTAPTFTSTPPATTSGKPSGPTQTFPAL